MHLRVLGRVGATAVVVVVVAVAVVVAVVVVDCSIAEV